MPVAVDVVSKSDVELEVSNVRFPFAVNVALADVESVGMSKTRSFAITVPPDTLIELPVMKLKIGPDPNVKSVAAFPKLLLKINVIRSL